MNPVKTLIFRLTPKTARSVALILCLLHFPCLSYGGIGDGLTDSEKKKVFNALKKINIRLTEMETQNFKSMQESQNSLQETQGMILMQIEGLRNIVPQMQGAIEQNRATLEARIGTLTDEIQKIKFQGEKDQNQIQSNWDALREKVNSQLETVRQSIALDIETLDKENKQFFGGMHNTNKEILGKVIASINRMDNRIRKTFKKIQDSLAKTEAKSQGIIKILQKSFTTQKTANETFQTQLNTLTENQKKANNNILITGQAIDKVMASNMKILDDNTRKIGEGVKVIGANFNNLGQSVNTLHANIAKLEEQSKNNAEKLMNKNQQALENISQTIQQTLTSDTLDAKLDKSAKGIQANQDHMELANQKLAKLIEIFKTMVSTQAQLEKSLQKQKTQVDRLSNEQVGMKNSLADLRRKANVNISRNDDIKKAQKEIKHSINTLLSSKVSEKP